MIGHSDAESSVYNGHFQQPKDEIMAHDWEKTFDQVGRVAVWAAHIEYFFETLFHILVDGEQAELTDRSPTSGQVLFLNIKQKGFASLLKTIQELLPVTGNSGAVSDFNKIKDKANKLMNRRNEVLHNMIQYSYALDTVGQIQTVKKLARVREMSPVDHKKMGELSYDMDNFASHEASDFLLKHFGETIYNKEGKDGG